jgi:hypothetical protein
MTREAWEIWETESEPEDAVFDVTLVEPSIGGPGGSLFAFFAFFASLPTVSQDYF